MNEFDAGYDCIEVEVYPSESEEPVKANVFVMACYESENAKLPMEKLAQEQFIHVIATGMKHHGINDEYIDYSILMCLISPIANLTNT